MPDAADPALADLADAIVGVVRQLRLPTDPSFVECTPVEISVMRAIHRSPGASARSIAEATLLPSSNFSRVLRGLVQKGLVRRDTDGQDARVSRLYPTELAEQSMTALRRVWSESLAGVVGDPADVLATTSILREIEAALIERRRGPGEPPGRAKQADVVGRDAEG